ncbi:MAG: phasin family protein [Pseudomonadota bacterium]|nr:phasin family protein [Pseudomonadota bacterium]
MTAPEHPSVDEKQAATDERAARRKSALDFRKYTQQIWLAGLGAFSRAEEEGTRLFDSLVKVGEELESKTTDIADSTVGAVEEVRERVTERVTDTRERVERVLDDRVSQTVSRIGLASHREVAQLTELIERLTQRVESLTDEVRALREMQSHSKK